MGNALRAAVVLSVIWLSSGREIISGVSAKWTFGDAGAFHMTNSFYWKDGLGPNIKKDVELTLDQAFNGVALSIPVDRVLLNPNCPITRCKVCYGVGKVSAQYTGPNLKQEIETPCPACAGMRYDTKTCNLFLVDKQVMSVTMPPGARAGFQHIIRGAGHETIENMEKVVGNFEVSVITVHGEKFNILPNQIELIIKISVLDALQGFRVEEPYANGMTLVIDRTGKVTLPGKKIILKEMGLPKVPISVISNTTQSEPTIIDGRDDLVVKFELSSDEEDLSLDGEGKDVDSDSERTKISSQEELNEYIEKQKNISEIAFARKLLMLLSKIHTENDDE